MADHLRISLLLPKTLLARDTQAMNDDITVEQMMALIDDFAKGGNHREKLTKRAAVFDAVCKMRGAVVQARHDAKKGKGKAG